MRAQHEAAEGALGNESDLVAQKRKRRKSKGGQRSSLLSPLQSIKISADRNKAALWLAPKSEEGAAKANYAMLWTGALGEMDQQGLNWAYEPADGV